MRNDIWKKNVKSWLGGLLSWLSKRTSVLLWVSNWIENWMPRNRERRRSKSTSVFLGKTPLFSAVAQVEFPGLNVPMMFENLFHLVFLDVTQDFSTEKWSQSFFKKEVLTKKSGKMAFTIIPLDFKRFSPILFNVG